MALTIYAETNDKNDDQTLAYELHDLTDNPSIVKFTNAIIFRVAPPTVEDLIKTTRLIPDMDEDTETDIQCLEEAYASVTSIAPRKILIAEDNEFILRLL